MTTRSCPVGLAVAVTLLGTSVANVLFAEASSILRHFGPGLAVVCGLCAGIIAGRLPSHRPACPLAPRVYGSRPLFYVSLACISLFVVVPGTLPELPVSSRGLFAAFIPAALAFGLDHWLAAHATHQRRPVFATTVRVLKFVLLAVVLLWYPVLLFLVWTHR